MDNFDVNVILIDRLNPFPGTWTPTNDFLETEEYKKFETDGYSNDLNSNRLYDIYKDSSLSLYNNIDKGSISISGNYNDGVITNSENININNKISLINNENLENIVDEEYSMNSKEIIIKQLDAYDLLKGLQEITPISELYFSNNNINAINNTIKYEIYKKTNDKIENQNRTELIIIMRSIYLQYSQNLITNDVLAEVKYLNKLVLNNVINRIEVEMKAYENYINYINAPNIVLNNPIDTSSDWRNYTYDFTDLI
tara:strand:+ start:292 stop:1056 length:765 start_codon:yes stop_codon:yes gene_type:complete